MLIFLGVVVVSVAWLGWEAYTAPEGYEDEHGFHYGHPPVINN